MTHPTLSQQALLPDWTSFPSRESRLNSAGGGPKQEPIVAGIIETGPLSSDVEPIAVSEINP